MEARLLRCAALAALVVSLAVAALPGATFRTTNFIVDAPTDALAKEIAEAAENYRRALAISWLGREMPRWPQPCPIRAQVAENLGAGGATQFMFGRGNGNRAEVFGWKMDIQGSRQRILDSVLPHEVTHTIFATHFRRPLPRWADEGACTTVEHAAERSKQQQWLITFLKTSRGIPFDKMFAMREYPNDILPLYAQGHATARFLIAQGGRRKFVQFMEAGFASDDWPAAVKQLYGYEDLRTLQTTWLEWVRIGSPEPIPAQFAGRPRVETVASTNPRSAGIYTRTASVETRVTGVENRVAGAESAKPRNPEARENLVAIAPVSRRVRPAAGSGIKLVTPDGWSSRSATSPTSAPLPSAVTQSSSSTAPLGDSRDILSRQSGRPHDAEEPRQVLLEWTRPTTGSAPAALDASVTRERVLR